MAERSGVGIIVVSVIWWVTSVVGDSKIYGGVRIDHAPSIVSVQIHKAHICGGSLLTMSLVLTSCHCLSRYGKTQHRPSLQHPEEIVASTCSVVAGETDLKLTSKSIQRRSARRVLLHPKCMCDEGIDMWDFGLIRLRDPFLASAFVQPAQLPSLNSFEIDQKIDSLVTSSEPCWILGWGTQSSNGLLTRYLKGTQMKLISDAECGPKLSAVFKAFEAYPFREKGQVCAVGVRSEESDCFGDSGGPVYCGGKVLGIVSYGFKCGSSDQPAVYTRLSFFIDWYKEATLDLENVDSRNCSWNRRAYNLLLRILFFVTTLYGT